MQDTILLISSLLVIISGIAWGSIGAFDYDIVDTYVGPMYKKYVYILVGLATLVLLGNKAKALMS